MHLEKDFVVDRDPDAARRLCSDDAVGRVSFEAKGKGVRVKLSMDGRTKPLVPEFTIKGTMQEQLDQMAKALERRLAEG